MKKKIYAATLILLSVITISSANASAMKSDGNDAREVLSVPVSLAQAVSIAEMDLKGKASQAEFDNSEGKLIYEVEIVTADKVMDVEIDAHSGKVLSSVQDKKDRDEEDDDHEEKGE